MEQLQIYSGFNYKMKRSRSNFISSKTGMEVKKEKSVKEKTYKQFHLIK